jgi:predicted nuclease of restriction endonuclease-like (RecB) superfamily
MQFAEIVVPLARHLSWSHFLVLIPVKNKDARTFYAQKAAYEKWSKRQLRKSIEQKVFERKEKANTKNNVIETEFKDEFKDPYFLDFLGLKDGYLENDLESAIIKELELFILELGKGFAFVERQKRMIIDGEDFIWIYYFTIVS